jgi:lysophospholipase L1-like esterase
MNRKAGLVLLMFCLMVFSCGGGGGGDPGSGTAPQAPQNVSSAGGNGQAYLSWGNVSGAATYNIYWSTNAGVSKQDGTKISVTASPYYHTGLNNSITYYYVVTAVNQYGESAESLEVSATPGQFTPPLPPTGIMAVAVDRGATISWNAVDDAITYNIYWSTSPDVSGQSGTKLANVTSPYTHSGLTQGETYYYVITAANGFGESNDSIKSSVTISDDRNDICVALGDSITYGFGATNRTTSSYVPVLSALWGKTVIAEAEDGGRSLDGVVKVNNILQKYNPRYLIIYYGTNDAGFFSPDSVIANLQYIIERAKAYGAIPVIATLGPCFDEWAWKAPDMLDLSARIRQLAADQGIAVADIDIALGWNRDYMADSLHPNDTGHRIIAETFLRALTR